MKRYMVLIYGYTMTAFLFDSLKEAYDLYCDKIQDRQQVELYRDKELFLSYIPEAYIIDNNDDDIPLF